MRIRTAFCSLLISQLVLITGVISSWQLTIGAQELPDQKRERLKDQAAEFWIYDDIDAGYSLAADTGKPMLVSFRCVP